MVTNVYVRIAKRDWTCCKCGRTIPTGQEYKDTETKTYFTHGFSTGINISHTRTCIQCPKKIYTFNHAEPVMYLDEKEWLIGKGFDDDGNLVLITREWLSKKKHWRRIVYDCNGNPLTVKNVRFEDAN